MIGWLRNWGVLFHQSSQRKLAGITIVQSVLAFSDTGTRMHHFAIAVVVVEDSQYHDLTLGGRARVFGERSKSFCIYYLA